MNISPEMAEFKLKLEKAYDETRSRIPQDASDEYLVASPEYKRCVLIYNVLSTIFRSEDGYEWGEAAAGLDDYDIERFLSRYVVEIVKGETGYKVDFRFNDERENTAKLQDPE